MKAFEIVLLVFLIIYLLALLIALSKVKKPVKFMLTQFAVSLICIAIINLTTFASGVHIPINYGTIIGTSVGGVPFLCGILAINVILPL